MFHLPNRFLRTSLIAVVGVAAALGTPTVGQAQTRCFQRVGGVPGAYNQPPDWWTAGATPLGSMTGRFVDDPRWQGASAFSHVSDTARFRTLVETEGAQRFLVMSWHIRADPTATNDRLYVGFWDESSTRGNVFRIEKAIAAATPVNGGTYATGAYNGRFYNKVGAGGWGLNNTGGLIPPPLPTWLKNDTRVDVFCSGAVCDEWAVRMRIPIDPAADVTVNDPTGVKITAGGVFRFWYQVQDGMSLGTAAAYSWPEGTSVAQEGNPPCSAIPPYCFPDPNDATNPWNRVQDTGTCNGDIGLLAGDTYANSAGSIQVNLTGSNAFHARPTNFMSAGQPGNAVKATFRIANWGSAVGVSPQWLPVCTDQVGTAGTVPPTTGKFDIVCNWTVPNPCDFRAVGDGCGNGSRTTDQCMLVDLASAPGGGPYFFSPQSAWQNMLFTGASRIVKTAVVDIKGLAPIAGGGPARDLYVYVKTRNMPSRVSGGDAPPPPDLERLPQRTRERLSQVGLPKNGVVDSATARRIQEAVGSGALTYDDVETIMPTYIAYVWHDTGRTLGAGADAVKVLEPQPAFGMFAWHDGSLNGWRQAFEGKDVVEISPNFYRISVPNNGAVTVTTRITACELPLCADHYFGRGMLLLLLILLLLFILVVVLIVRRLTSP